MMREDRSRQMPLRGTLRHAEPMSRHVSWRAGGCARTAYVPADADDLAAFVARQPADEALLFVGLGSNLLVRDGGYDGTVLFLHPSLSRIDWLADRRVFVEAGVAAPKLARLAANHGLTGAEFLAGIPGTIGGALTMNAGCHGAETWDIVSAVRTLDRAGNTHTRSPADFEVGYRHVRGKTAAEEWFTGAWFALAAGDAATSRARIKDLLARRIASQPLSLPNCGSVFRNPPGDHAARLIEACGLKGFCLGGACVSTKHANFIVNAEGRATAGDIEALIAHVARTVLARHGVALETEVHIVGRPA